MFKRRAAWRKEKNVISASEEQPSAQLIVGNGFQISPR